MRTFALIKDFPLQLSTTSHTNERSGSLWSTKQKSNHQHEFSAHIEESILERVKSVLESAIEQLKKQRPAEGIEQITPKKFFLFGNSATQVLILVNIGAYFAAVIFVRHRCTSSSQYTIMTLFIKRNLHY